MDGEKDDTSRAVVAAVGSRSSVGFIWLAIGSLCGLDRITETGTRLKDSR